MERLDEKDTQILTKRRAAFDAIKGPRVGDFIKMLDGTLQRFSHDWDDDIQTAEGGSFYIGPGYVSFSGGLNPAIPKASIILTDEVSGGAFWFFHHDQHRAHNGVNFFMPCRIFKQI